MAEVHLPAVRPSAVSRLPWALPLLVALLPAGLVLADMLAYDGTASLPAFARDTLFSATGARSLAVSVTAGLLAALLGLAPGLALASRPRGWRRLVCGLWLAGLALPPVFLGGVWSHLTGLGPSPPRSDEADLLRWLTLSGTWGVSLAPLGSLVVLLSLSRIPRGELAAGQVYLSAMQRWRVVLLPALRGGLALAAVAAASLAFTDAATPAHFGVQTTAGRAALEFQSTLQTAPAGAVVLPPWLLAGVLLSLLAPKPEGRGRLGAVVVAGSPTWLLVTGTLALSLGVPMLGLALTAGEALRPHELARYTPELTNSLQYSLVGGLAALLLALSVLALDASTRGGGRSLLLAGAALLLTAPGMVVGYSALIAQLQLGGTQPAWWWLGFLLRCAPWCLPLLIWGAAGRPALALGLPPGRRVLAALAERGPALSLAAFVAGAAGALREVEYFAAFSLPAGESLAARSAQMLHFGMRPQLAALMLLQLALAAGWSFAAVTLAGRSRA